MITAFTKNNLWNCTLSFPWSGLTFYQCYIYNYFYFMLLPKWIVFNMLTLHLLSLLISSYCGKFPWLPMISAYSNPTYFSRHLQCSVLHRAFPDPRDGNEFFFLPFSNVLYVSVLSLYFCMVLWVNLDNNWPYVITPICLFPIAPRLVFYIKYLGKKWLLTEWAYKTVIQFNHCIMPYVQL